jgi:hypothetical protein
MVIARGIMQSNKINIWDTSTVINFVTPSGTINCGTIVTFYISVFATLASVSPTGIVQLIDSGTGSVVAYGTLSPATSNSSTVTISTTLSVGSAYIYAIYIGNVGGPDVNHQFKLSSSGATYFNINLVGSTTTITTPTTYYCSATDLTAQAHVVATSGGANITSGSVLFNLWHKGTSISLGSSTLDAGGHATAIIPAGSTSVDGYNYYLQASFFGSGCYSSSTSPANTSGLQVIPVIGDVTNTSISATSSSFSLYASSTYTVNIHTTHLSGTTTGTLTVTCVPTGGGTTTILGIITGPTLNGYTFTAPANSFPSLGSFYVNATYSGDACFAGSSASSNSVTVTTTANTTTTTIKNFSPTSICNQVVNTYTANIQSTNTNAVGGIINFYASVYGLIGSVAVPSPTPSNTNFSYNIPANIFSTGSQYVYAQFVSDGTNFEGNSTSSNYAITVQGQITPTVALSTSVSSGSRFQPLTLTATVNHNSGVGSLTTPVGLVFEYSDPSAVFHTLSPNINLVDTGNPSTATYLMSSAGPQGAGTYTYYVNYLGNSCFNSVLSSGVTKTWT